MFGAGGAVGPEGTDGAGVVLSAGLEVSAGLVGSAGLEVSTGLEASVLLSGRLASGRLVFPEEVVEPVGLVEDPVGFVASPGCGTSIGALAKPSAAPSEAIGVSVGSSTFSGGITTPEVFLKITGACPL